MPALKFSSANDSGLGKLFKIKDSLKTVSAGRSDRVANALKQRDQILDQISQISNYATFQDFFENYKSRMTRINDRENQIFLKALL